MAELYVAGEQRDEGLPSDTAPIAAGYLMIFDHCTLFGTKFDSISVKLTAAYTFHNIIVVLDNSRWMTSPATVGATSERCFSRVQCVVYSGRRVLDSQRT